MRPKTLIGLIAATAGVVSCGRPPGFATNYAGIEQPGIVATTASASKAPQPVASSPSPAKLQAKLRQLTERHQQVLSQLEGLPAQISDAQDNASAIQSQMQAELAQKARQYSADDFQYRLGQQSRKDAEGQLTPQIQQAQKELSNLNATYQWQVSEGYYSPGGVVSEDEVNLKAQELAALQTQYQNLQAQDEQAAAVEQSHVRWEEEPDQSGVQQNYQQSLAQANQTVAELSTRYQKLDQEADQLRQSMGQIEDDLSTGS